MLLVVTFWLHIDANHIRVDILYIYTFKQLQYGNLVAII
jgi:hypothetical protein